MFCYFQRKKRMYNFKSHQLITYKLYLKNHLEKRAKNSRK